MFPRRWCWMRRISSCNRMVRIFGLIIFIAFTVMPSLIMIFTGGSSDGEYEVRREIWQRRSDLQARSGEYQSLQSGLIRKPQAAPAFGTANPRLTRRVSNMSEQVKTHADDPLLGPAGSVTQIRGSSELCRSLSLMNPPGPKTALFSFPGSGNTWIRHLIQIATGLATGSVYYDMTLKRMGFFAEGVRDGRAVVIKTHEAPTYSQVKFDKMIIIVRNPFGALKAEFNRRHAGHKGHARAHIFTKNNGKYWKEYAMQGAQQWEETTKQWLELSRNLSIHVVTYEDMKRDTWGQMEDLITFLNLTQRGTDEWHECREKFAQGKFLRTKVPLPFRLYTSDMVAAIEERIRRIALLLSELMPQISASGLIRSFYDRRLPENSLDFAFTGYDESL